MSFPFCHITIYTWQLDVHDLLLGIRTLIGDVIWQYPDLRVSAPAVEPSRHFPDLELPVTRDTSALASGISTDQSLHPRRTPSRHGSVNHHGWCWRRPHHLPLRIRITTIQPPTIPPEAQRVEMQPRMGSPPQIRSPDLIYPQRLDSPDHKALGSTDGWPLPCYAQRR